MGCGQAMAEDFWKCPSHSPAVSIHHLLLHGYFNPMGGGGPKLSWVLGMLYKEKFHCFHCEILPQATSECSREDTHHFQQNSWQIHLLLLVIFGAIFKSLRNIRSYSPSEKPSSPHRTTAKEGETTNFCSIFLNFKGKLLLKYLNTDEHEVWRNCYWVTMSFPRNIDAQEGNFRST